MGCRSARLYHDQILQADEGGGAVACDRVSRKRKLRRFAAGFRLKVRKCYADEADAFGWRVSGAILG
jgi:hypothetical protein